MISSLTDDFDPVVVDTIIARLDAVASDEGVAIPWAIESGAVRGGSPPRTATTTAASSTCAAPPST